MKMSPRVLLRRKNNSNEEIFISSYDDAEIELRTEESEIGRKNNSRNARKYRKDQRNSGNAYTTATGKVIEAKKMRPLKDCRANCKNKMNDVKRKRIFEEYWGQKSYDDRSAYIGSLIDYDQKKCSRPRFEDPEKEKFRQITASYFLSIDGKRIKVCKGCFIHTFDETDNFLKVVIAKKQSSTAGIISKDQRGRTTPANAHDEKKLDEVQQHLKSFPSYESHYSRKVSTAKYLPSYFTIRQMYELYKEKTNQPVSEKIYRREFHKLNLKIKTPAVDTCDTCDKFQMKINMAIKESERKKLIKERNTHQMLADQAFTEKSKDTAISKKRPNTKCLPFDLEQCLPMPSLTASIVFYLRQLWTYNLTIHDNETSLSKHCMWHEAISNRGANQIASCLYSYLMKVPPEVEHVIFYSDTCGGQNKNSHVAAMFMYFLSEIESNIKIIDHKFLVPGHTYMEADGAHGIIEKKKKKYKLPINVPEDWMQLVRESSSTFEVVPMKKENFFNFAELLKGPLVLRKKDLNGKPFKWHDAQWFRYEKSALFGRVKFKNSLSRSESFKKLCLRRRGIHRRPYSVNLVSTTPLPISSEKKKDLLDLLDLIPKKHHSFYKSLPVANDPNLNNYPDIDGIDPDEDGWETNDGEESGEEENEDENEEDDEEKDDED